MQSKADAVPSILGDRSTNGSSNRMVRMRNDGKLHRF